MADVNVKEKELEGKDVKICDLIHLAHMPEVNKMFLYKLGEVTGGMLQKSIFEYNIKMAKYWKRLFYKVRRSEKRAGKKSYIDLYWFELSKFEESDWGLTVIDPWPPPLTPHFTVMPQEIIDRIAEFPVKTGKLVTWGAVYSQDLKKIFAVKFVKLSTNHIVGVARETSDAKENPELATAIEEYASHRESEQERKLRYYLVKRPELCKDFIKSFIQRLLPYVAECDNRGKKQSEKGS